MVNNFNETILSTIRCNMDIKFIGSGESVKAILYYITDYISKAQLKAHVAYAALELAVRKLGEYKPLDNELTIQAKQMLQKCAHAMISQQELSAQQVASYLLDYEDHFTSHEFNHLFWTTFEAHVHNENPSPECYNKPAEHPEDPRDDDKYISHPDSDDNIILVVSSSTEDSTPDSESEDTIDYDEIGVSVDDNDNIVAHSSQLTDYRY